jgi:hypothetical protein
VQGAAAGSSPYLRFGSWRRVCALLGQPYGPGNQFADRGAEAGMVQSDGAGGR